MSSIQESTASGPNILPDPLFRSLTHPAIFPEGRYHLAIQNIFEPKKLRYRHAKSSLLQFFRDINFISQVAISAKIKAIDIYHADFEIIPAQR